MNLPSSKERRKFSFDLKTFLPMILLCIIGLVTLVSTTILPGGGFDDLSVVWKQVGFISIGLVFYFLLGIIDLSFLKYWQVLLAIYLVTVGLLVAVLFFGPVINEVRRWLVIGGFQLQPSEVAKVSVIVATASIFSMKGKFNELVLLGITLLGVAAIFVLIYLEPGGSMSLLTITIWFLMTFLALSNPLRNTAVLVIIGSISGAFLLAAITNNLMWYLLIIVGVVLTVFILYSKNSWKIFSVISVIIGLLLGIFFSVAWDNILHDYQKDRIVAYFNPSETTSDIGFNVNQSRIAIGSGQIFGKGFGNGTQSKRNFLPEHQTDFIFASFAEEFGLVGSIFILGLYGVLIVHCFVLGMNMKDDPMSSLICIGIGIKILLEVFINIGTNTGTIPATGIPLPLMSAGGSITIMTFISLGLIQNIYSKYVKGNQNKNAQILEINES